MKKLILVLILFLLLCCVTSSGISNVTIGFLPFQNSVLQSAITYSNTILYESNTITVNTNTYPASFMTLVDYTFFIVSSSINTSVALNYGSISWTPIDSLFGTTTPITYADDSIFAYYPSGTTLPACRSGGGSCDGFSIPIASLALLLPASAYTFNFTAKINITTFNGTDIIISVNSIPFSLFVDRNWFVNNYTYISETRLSQYSASGDGWNEGLTVAQQVLLIITFISLGLLLIVIFSFVVWLTTLPAERRSKAQLVELFRVATKK